MPSQLRCHTYIVCSEGGRGGAEEESEEGVGGRDKGGVRMPGNHTFGLIQGASDHNSAPLWLPPEALAGSVDTDLISCADW